MVTVVFTLQRKPKHSPPCERQPKKLPPPGPPWREAPRLGARSQQGRASYPDCVTLGRRLSPSGSVAGEGVGFEDLTGLRGKGSACSTAKGPPPGGAAGLGLGQVSRSPVPPEAAPAEPGPRPARPPSNFPPGPAPAAGNRGLTCVPAANGNGACKRAGVRLGDWPRRVGAEPPQRRGPLGGSPCCGDGGPTRPRPGGRRPRSGRARPRGLGGAHRRASGWPPADP